MSWRASYSFEVAAVVAFVDFSYAYAVAAAVAAVADEEASAADYEAMPLCRIDCFRGVL